MHRHEKSLKERSDDTWLFFYVAFALEFLGVVLFTGTLTHSTGSRLIRQFFSRLREKKRGKAFKTISIQ